MVEVRATSLNGVPAALRGTQVGVRLVSWVAGMDCADRCLALGGDWAVMISRVDASSGRA